MVRVVTLVHVVKYLKEEMKSHKEKRRVKKDKHKQSEIHYQNVVIKKEQSTLSSASESHNKTPESVYGRSIDFAVHRSMHQWHQATCERTSNKDYRKTARLKIRQDGFMSGSPGFHNVMSVLTPHP
ncbi:hypothetical protein L798_01075 [Zootermopsis nevadensis]|uniref:Uncharacterized protein n=1 Tax=Zootermopsis nevadensis TaxID=136037 RepID=A0A067RP20_ZOONE|nr:hypothetical protein L798_01075 [Zootermopsis nevadensis]